MIARTGSGWQTVLADLSLILFMITAAAVSEVKPQVALPPAASQAAPPALGEPVAVWRDAAGSPPLAEWLRRTGADPRLRLTIVSSTAAAPQALELARASGRPARIVIDPDITGTPFATLTYDQAGLAQRLPDVAAKEKLP